MRRKLVFVSPYWLHNNLTEVIPSPKKPQKHWDGSPVGRTKWKVLQFLGCVWNIKRRTILTVCYATGLRVSAC